MRSCISTSDDDKECSKRERWENKKFNEIDSRISELEASSASHTERLQKYSDNNTLWWNQLKEQLNELKEHDIFKIWDSVRRGGKTTLDAILKDHQRIISNYNHIRNSEEVLRELITHLPYKTFDFEDEKQYYNENYNSKNLVDGLLAKLEGPRDQTDKPEDKNCPYKFDYYGPICQECDWFEKCYDRACKGIKDTGHLVETEKKEVDYGEWAKAMEKKEAFFDSELQAELDSGGEKECDHEWEFRDPENLGHDMLFCKKCGYLRDSKPPERRCAFVDKFKECHNPSCPTKECFNSSTCSLFKDQFWENMPREDEYYDLPNEFIGSCYFDSFANVVKIKNKYRIVKREDLNFLYHLAFADVCRSINNDLYKKRFAYMTKIKEAYGIE